MMTDKPTSQPDRTALRHDFLQRSGYGNWQENWIPGDASFRRYCRLTHQDQSLILMDAPPPIEDVNPFVTITNVLNTMGDPLIKAPTILAADGQHGFLVLEDLGSENLRQRLDTNPAAESALYGQATDILTHLHQTRSLPSNLPKNLPENLPVYDDALYRREIQLFADWFLPAMLGTCDLSAEFTALFEPLLAVLEQDTTPKVLVLRDYHAENMMMIDGDRIALIDYQDAVMGHPAYDLVSLLQDARRFVSPEIEAACLGQFLKAYSGDTEKFRQSYAIIGLQRALKILGIFMRLALRDGKPRYLDYFPHMWQMVARTLSDPIMDPMKQFLDSHIPAHTRATVPDYDSLQKRFPVPQTAMILAAGMGSRMGELSDHTPKPLVSVAGTSLLDRALDHCFAAGVTRAVVNVHHLADQIESATHARQRPPQVTIADERAKLLETGGGVMQALPLIDAAVFYVINSDALWLDQRASIPLLRRLAAAFDGDKMDILLAVMPVADAPGYDGVGDLSFDRDSETGPAKISLRGDAPSASHMFAGVRIMKASCFDGEQENTPWSMRRLFKKAEAAGRLYGVAYDGVWLHVGDPQALADADKRVSIIEGNHP